MRTWVGTRVAGAALTALAVVGVTAQATTASPASALSVSTGVSAASPTSTVRGLWRTGGDLVVWGLTRNVPAGTAVTVRHQNPDGTWTVIGGTTADVAQWSLTVPAATASGWVPGSAIAVRIRVAPSLTVTGVVPRPPSPPAGPPVVDLVAIGAARADAADRAPVGNPDGYQVLTADGTGRAGRHDPCSPIPVRVNLAGAPERAGEVVADTLARVQASTGWQFGPVETTGWTWPGDGPAGAIARSAGPGLTIVFSTATAMPAGTVGVAHGVTAVAWSRAPAGLRIDAAAIAIPTDTLNRWKYQGRSAATLLLRPILLHELGHALGLGHVDDPEQVMFFRTGSPFRFGLSAGDLRGLRGLRSSDCLP